MGSAVCAVKVAHANAAATNPSPFDRKSFYFLYSIIYQVLGETFGQILEKYCAL